MTINFTKDEALNYFYDSLCNGLIELGYLGIELDFLSEDYKMAKQSLLNKGKTDTICYEDVLIEMISMGLPLHFIDHNEEGKKITITQTDVTTKMSKVPVHHLVEIIQERDDADTACAVLQTILFGEIIYG